MKKLTLHFSTGNYSKALERLKKNIRSGRFASYTQRKKQQIWKRLCRYAKQLGIRIKAPIATACIAAGLCLATPAESQVSFTQQIGASNPFNGVDVGDLSVPAFADIDGDGDLDAFIGRYDGDILYYENTGTSLVPVFTPRTGVSNPLDGVNAGSRDSSPVFADIDGDGDLDVFIGSYNGTILYYKNTGTSTVPVFTQQTGIDNPFDGVDISFYSIPSFADIDGDGDLDAFIGTQNNELQYYKNTGSSTAPVFVQQTGVANPFDGVSTGYRSSSAFADLDGDGDLDILIGDYYGDVRYFKNTGTSILPAFTLQSGSNNPFDGVNVGFYAKLAFEDIDGDGDKDVFTGNYDGSISYFSNTTILLPLQLLNFNGSSHAGYNQLQWKTAEEVNTQQFELESSSDGISFTKIATIHAAGSGNNDYSYADKGVYTGKVFYRLRMVDIDGKFTYSSIIFLNSGNTRGISIYPNPATDVVTISVNQSLLKTTSQMYNADGRLMQNILINNNQQQINVKTLTTGMYYLRFVDGTVLRFVKQ